MTVEILKVKKNTYGSYMLLVKESDGVVRCWAVGERGYHPLVTSWVRYGCS